ncbi:hypothetical protein [Micavibrio aeruginosavorus]|uniref:Uncharacterized protein n=1 Tax=Micavibrio aeruginosavorus (strain ARL-13) TaxID=856793 RepID=G2KNX7_MICAA|nr:hypothetical protein [Micavibrio aeruginosavorus]AEP10772.1 hypothetical protein MICA_2471 [Micavibrio aeruginosavorus ARL-13]
MTNDVQNHKGDLKSLFISNAKGANATLLASFATYGAAVGYAAVGVSSQLTALAVASLSAIATYAYGTSHDFSKKDGNKLLPAIKRDARIKTLCSILAAAASYYYVTAEANAANDVGASEPARPVAEFSTKTKQAAPVLRAQ